MATLVNYTCKVLLNLPKASSYISLPSLQRRRWSIPFNCVFSLKFPMKKYLLLIEGNLIDKKDDVSVTRSVRLSLSVFLLEFGEIFRFSN